MQKDMVIGIDGKRHAFRETLPEKERRKEGGDAPDSAREGDSCAWLFLPDREKKRFPLDVPKPPSDLAPPSLDANGEIPEDAGESLFYRELFFTEEYTAPSSSRETAAHTPVPEPYYKAGMERVCQEDVRAYAEEYGGEAHGLLLVLLVYCLLEYQNASLHDLLDILVRPEQEVTDILFSLADCHPAKQRYMGYVAGKTPEDLEGEMWELYGRMEEEFLEGDDPSIRELIRRKK